MWWIGPRRVVFTLKVTESNAAVFHSSVCHISMFNLTQHIKFHIQIHVGCSAKVKYCTWRCMAQLFLSFYVKSCLSAITGSYKQSHCKMFITLAMHFLMCNVQTKGSYTLKDYHDNCTCCNTMHPAYSMKMENWWVIWDECVCSEFC